MTIEPHDPAFTREYVVDRLDEHSVAVRHRTEGHWWRFDVAEKNGRLQLVHADHRAGAEAGRDIASCAVDAYDTATLEARRRGMVD